MEKKILDLQMQMQALRLRVEEIAESVKGQQEEEKRARAYWLNFITNASSTFFVGMALIVVVWLWSYSGEIVMLLLRDRPQH